MLSTVLLPSFSKCRCFLVPPVHFDHSDMPSNQHQAPSHTAQLLYKQVMVLQHSADGKSQQSRHSEAKLNRWAGCCVYKNKEVDVCVKREEKWDSWELWKTTNCVFFQIFDIKSN